MSESQRLAAKTQAAMLSEELDALLALGFDVGDVLHATGLDYFTARRRIRRNLDRPDLLDALATWKRADTERVKHATGLVWK